MRQNDDVDSNVLLTWFARAAVAGVFALNLGCAVSFIVQPAQYTSAFEISGLPGRLLVQALGILFLMWNTTYPPVLIRPDAHKTLFGVILVQQAIGLTGETGLWLTLPSGHSALWNTGLRFMIFDGIGLALMGVAYGLLWTTVSQSVRSRLAKNTQVEAQKLTEP